MKNFLLLLLLPYLFVSCGYESIREKSNSFEAILEGQTGHQYTSKKFSSANGQSYVVYLNETTGKYEAYNLDKWDSKNFTSYKQYLANGVVEGVDIVKGLDPKTQWVESGYWQDVYETQTDYWEEYDEGCDCWVEYSETYEVKVDSYWVDTSSYVTYYYGGGFKFSNTKSISKDLELMASLDEKTKLGVVSYKLKNDYKLSDSRSLELAKMVTKYQKMESTRELTTDEKDHFAKKALGMSLGDIEDALKKKSQGDGQKLTSLIKKAAKVNDTSVENIGKFVDDFSDQLK